MGAQVAGAMGAVKRTLRMGQRVFVQVSRQDFDGPVFEALLGFFEQKHAQAVGFFSGRAAGAPDPQTAEWELGLGRDDFRNNDVAQSVQLRLVAEKTSFSNGDFI